MASLGIRAWFSRVITTRITRAFDKVNPRGAGKTSQILHVEKQRPFHESMDQKFMLPWIDLRNPSVVPLKMERRRRDDAVEILQRSPTSASARSRGIAE